MTDSPQNPNPELSFGINAPELVDLKPTRKAIASAGQAWAIFNNLRRKQETRNLINSKIQDNWRGKAPYENVAPWQSNFSVLFLSGIVDKVTPVLVSYIENAKWLTQSKLKDESQQGESASNDLRDLFTKTVRRWPGWRSFVSGLCQELVLIGYTFACRTDEYDWRPKHYRQDQAFVHDKTPQHSEYVQVLAIEEDILLHKIVDIIQNKEAAEAAKWDVDNTVEAINGAMPQNDQDASSASNPRKWVDVIQEGNLGMTYSDEGALSVKVAHILAVETGEKDSVTHYIINREGEHKALLAHEQRFKSMRDVVTLFTLDPGNSTFYGTRGIGARLSNYSVAMNGVVNDAIDAGRVSGLIIAQADLAKGTPMPKVKKPFLWMTKDSTVITQTRNIEANMQAYVLLIDKIGQLAEVAAQQYIPNTSGTDTQSSSKHPTAHQVAIDYQREQQSVATFVARFAGQFGELIGMMQRAMCDPETNDHEAEDFRAEALLILKVAKDPEAALAQWASSPPAEVLQDLTAQESQSKLMIANDPEVIQSPLIDQEKRLEMKLLAVLPSSLAKSLMKPDAIDPGEEKEQVRAQIGESEDILSGASVPVAPRDNDKVHLDWMLPDMAKGLQGFQQTLQQNPKMVMDPKTGDALDHLHAGLTHAEAHLQNWEQKGANPQELEPYIAKIKDGRTQVDETAKGIMKMQGEAAQAQQSQAQEQAPQGAAPPEPPKPIEPSDLVKMYTYDGTPDDIRRQLELKLDLKPHEEAAPAAVPTPSVPGSEPVAPLPVEAPAAP